VHEDVVRFKAARSPLAELRVLCSKCSVLPGLGHDDLGFVPRHFPQLPSPAQASVLGPAEAAYPGLGLVYNPPVIDCNASFRSRRLMP